MSSFNCCFLTCIQISQEVGQVVWYSHLFQNFPQFIVIHTVKGVAQSCPTLFDPMNYSTPGFPALHYLPEFALTHAHWVVDAIQPSHPLSPTPPPALNLFQNQGLFQWVRWYPKYWTFTFSISPVNIQGWCPLGLADLISLLSVGLSRVFSSTTTWKHQLFSAQPSLWSKSDIHTWLPEKS